MKTNYKQKRLSLIKILYIGLLGGLALGTASCSKGGGGAAGISPIKKASPSPSPSPSPSVSVPAPIVSVPSPLSVVSNASSLVISGSCASGHTVFVTGDDSQQMLCADNSFSFTLNKSVEGSFIFHVNQVNSNAIASPAVNVQWIRDTTAPSAPTISTPASNPFTSNSNQLQVAGACEIGATVKMSGDVTDSINCLSGQYAFTLSLSSDGTLNVNLSQTDSANNTSGNTSFSWTRDTNLALSPSITAPTGSPFYTNSPSLILSGTCNTGDSLEIKSGVLASEVNEPAGSLSQSCVSGAFSYTLTKPTDGNYSLIIVGKNSIDNESAPVNFNWVLDRAIPAAPAISSPASNPLTSSNTSMTLGGSCETGATVYLSGDASDQVICAASNYSFHFSKSSDATYNFSIYQIDLAGNSSSNASFQWIRDTQAPNAPIIITPASNPLYNNASSLTLTGSCEGTDTLLLSGTDSQSVSCASNSFSFTINMSADASYSFLIAEKDSAGNTSSPASFTWVRDTVSPAAIEITAPASNPYVSSESNFLLRGSCEENATVNVSGAETLSQLCTEGSFSFNVGKSVDATYLYTLAQTDQAGNPSSEVSFEWTRNSSIPETPTLTSPAVSPFSSKLSSLTLSGSCTLDNQVYLSGDDSQSVLCADGTFSFTVNKTTDATYNFNVLQKNNAGTPSATVTQIWNRDTLAPVAISISSPANPYVSGDTSFTLSGVCEANAIVNLSGDDSASTVCSALGSFSHTISKNADGIFNFTLNQTDTAGNTSSNTSFQWTRDTAIPATPTITTPASNPSLSNTTSLNISGGCTTGNTVLLSGDSIQSIVCDASQYSFTVNKTTDGTYSFSIAQKTITQYLSSPISLTWTLDTTPPSAVTINQPLPNPYLSADTTINIGGNCEVGAMVHMTGSTTANVLCPSNGIYSIASTQNVDGVYNYSIKQTDPAGNNSDLSTFQWTRDTTIPPTPTITTPTSSTVISKVNTLTIAGTCTSGLDITLGGNVAANEVITPSNSLTQTCTADAFSFTLSKASDSPVGTPYTLDITQTDTANGLNSGAATVYWTLDRAAPSTPTITDPAQNPYYSSTNITVKGGCEVGATVNLSGDFTQSVLCDASAHYQFPLTAPSDGAYSFSISQTDAANNTSSSITQQWTKDPAVTSAPTVLTPSGSIAANNASFLTISGSCINGYTITLGGNIISEEVTTPAASLAQVCAGSQYSFTIQKTTDSPAGNPYIFTLKQTSNSMVDSGTVNVSWTRDATPPTTTITAPASAVHYPTNKALIQSISFSANETATFQCKLDTGAWSACVSPWIYTFTTPAGNGSHTLYVQATDSFANPEATPQSITWTQQAYKTVALYHFDSITTTSPDSSTYAENTLTVSGATADTANKKFGASSVVTGTNKYLSVADKNSQQTTTNALTVETFFRVPTMPTTFPTYYVIASKSGNASGSYGWEWGIKFTASNARYFYLRYSTDGVNFTESVSTTSFSMSAGNTYYGFMSIAFSGSTGTVRFYRARTGAPATAGTLTISGAKLFIPAVDLNIGTGYNGAYLGNFFKGNIDELRISQITRPNPTAVPGAAFTAD